MAAISGSFMTIDKYGLAIGRVQGFRVIYQVQDPILGAESIE
jgi:hypothetical protein